MARTKQHFAFFMFSVLVPGLKSSCQGAHCRSHQEASECVNEEGCHTPDQATLLQISARSPMDAGETTKTKADSRKEASNRATSTSLATTYRCVGVEANRSCLFRNLYYENGNFVMYVIEKPQAEDIRLLRADKYDYPWLPHVQTFSDEKAIADHVNKKDTIEEQGLSVYFNPLFHQNIGHALFDGLYPAFLATVKLGVSEQPWRPVVGVDAGCFADSNGQVEIGTVVEAYLPHAKYERTLRPLRAKVTSIQTSKRVGNMCEWKSDLDHKGLDLGSTSSASKDGCSRDCSQSFACKAAVLYGGICYLKGEGGQPITSAGREVCVLKESLSLEKSHMVVLPEQGQGIELADVSIPQEWVLGKVRQRCMSEGVFETFGGVGEIRRLFELERDSRNRANLVVRFEEIVMGVGGAGNLIADRSGAIGGSVAPQHTMSRFRDRMLKNYGLDIPIGAKPVPSDQDLNVIMVENKRFRSQDRSALGDVIQRLNQQGHVHAEFVDWAQIGDSEHKFRDHLKRVQEADVYISSIGTALQYVPFLGNGKVYIALGSVWMRSGRYFPTFMEQQLAGGGTPYLRTLYADPGAVLRQEKSSVSLGEDGYFVGVDGNMVGDLVKKAESLVRHGFDIPVSIEDNLSVEGKVLVELCKRDASACAEMNAYRNSRLFECEALLWNEAVVYEVGPWGDAAKCGDSHRKLLRELRKEYGLPAYGAPDI